MRRVFSTLLTSLFLCLFILIGMKSNVYAYVACAPKEMADNYYCNVNTQTGEESCPESGANNYDPVAANYCCGVVNQSEGACDEYCFLPGTMVKSGSGVKKIENIKIGDKVTSFVGDKITESKVSQIFERKRDYYYILEAGDERGNHKGYPYTVKASAEHPFYVGNNEYKKISELKKGDTVYVLFTQRPPSSLRTRRSGKIIPFTNKKEIAMKKLLIILLCAALTACSSNNVNTPTFTQPSSTPIKAPETETKMPTQEAIPTPEAVVMPDSEAEKAGIRVGATAKENPDGSYTYTYTNTNNDRTIENVGTAKIVDGKIEYTEAEFLNEQISTCGDMQAKMKENKANKKDLLDGIERWALDQVEGNGVNIPDVILNALVNDKTPFPESALTGQALDTVHIVGQSDGITESVMVWDTDVQKIMDNDSGKRPYIQLGCVAVDMVADIPTVGADGVITIEKVKEKVVAVLTKWLNPPDADYPNGSQVVVVTYFSADYFLKNDVGGFVFNSRSSALIKTSTIKFLRMVEADDKKIKILEKWNGSEVVPWEVETNGGFMGRGADAKK